MAAVLKTNGCKGIEHLLELCDVSKLQIKIDDGLGLSSSKVPSLTFSSGNTAEGVNTVAVYIATVCKDNLLGDTSLIKAKVHQWLEYQQNQVEQALQLDKCNLKPVLQDLDCHLLDKVYLSGLQLSLADVMLYYTINTILSDLMPQDREMYINITRWFRQVQSLLSERQSLPRVSIHRNLLYS